MFPKSRTFFNYFRKVNCYPSFKIHMKKTLLAALLVSALYTKSQTYTNTNYAAAGDTIFLTSDSSIISSNNYDTTGIGITWDFSNLKGKSQDNIEFKNTNQAGFSLVQWPYIYNANNVNLASTDGDVIAIGSVQKTNPYQYYKISSSGLELRAESYELSVLGKTFSVKNQYSSADVIYKFPLNVGNNDSSTANSTTNIPDIYYENVSIKRVNHVDASGTLITPFGTFSNTLRLISTVTETDTFAINQIGIPAITYNYRELKWFVSAKNYPILVVKQYLANGKWVTEEVSYLDNQQFFQPKALFAYYPAAPSVGDTVQFQNLSTNASTYSWNFADAASGSSNTSSALNPTHIFSSEGLFSVQLIVQNGTLKDTVTIPVSINNGVKPVADFTIGASLVCTKDSITITNNSTNASYNQWYFEGGLPVVYFDKNPKAITYYASGTYKVKLIVSNSNGVDSMEKTVSVNAVPSKPNEPKGEFALSENPGNKMYTTNSVSGATKYNWSISPSNAGTTSSTDSSASIAWSSNYTGNAEVKVSAENNCGTGKYSDSLIVVISPVTFVKNVEANVFPTIYPNPSKGVVFIDGIDAGLLEIYNLQGKLIYSMNSNGKTSISLMNGVYFVKSYANGKLFSQKLVINGN